MNGRDILVYGFVVLLIVGVLSPVTLSYVTSDSMSPAIETGDAYLVVPSGGVDEGDVITFYAEETNQFITHRVVEVRPDGYITMGDQNAKTDQEAGTVDGPVTKENVAGKVFSIGGEPFTVSGGADAAKFVGQNGAVLFGLGIVLVIGNELINRRSNERETQKDERIVDEVGRTHKTFLVAFLVGVVLVSVMNPGTVLTFIATDQASGSLQSVPVGEEVTRSASFNGSAIIPSYKFGTVDRGEVTAVEEDAGGVDIEFTVGAYPVNGPYNTVVQVFYYPKTLPYGVVAWLHGVHPALAGAGTMGMLVLVPYVISLALVLRTPPIRKVSRGDWL